MMLLDDADELPASPDQAEASLMTQLGDSGLRKIDQTLLGCVQVHWLKVARVVHAAITAGSFLVTNEVIDLHARRASQREPGIG